MKNKLWMKGSVIGIILLFIGTSVIPVVNANIVKNNFWNYNDEVSKYINRIKNNRDTETVLLPEKEMSLNIFKEKFYQIFYNYNKNMSKEEFKLKYGPVLKKIYYQLLSYTEKKISNLDGNYSKDYNEFKKQYDRLLRWCGYINYREYQDNYVTFLFIIMFVVNFIGGLASLAVILSYSAGNILGAVLGTAIIFGFIDAVMMWYQWRIAAWVGILNAASVRLSVCCQYTENGQTKPITNANISAYNEEDVKHEFGTHYLLPEGKQPGWYYTKSILELDRFIPPGYWIITVNVPGFEEKIIKTYDIPRAGEYAIVVNYP